MNGTMSCPSCAREVSTTAEQCPSCGRRLRGGGSPAIVLFAAGLLGMLLLGGVGVLFTVQRRHAAMREAAEAARQRAESRRQPARYPSAAGERALQRRKLEQAPREKLAGALLDELDAATLQRVLRRLDDGD